ncbi:MAG: tetratricopeptide repeat protein, partial [Rhodospirillaceae bacterium]|nr:tetratricopeptide repeat protein [Rhodospirillaceae bacterium]
MPRSTPRIDEKAFLVEALSQHKAGNYERARDLYLAILTQNPKNAGAIFRLGTLALHIENYEKAVEFIEEAI